MSAIVDPAVKATVEHFADDLRRLRGISDEIMVGEIQIAVEMLREEHGIEVSEKMLAKMAGVR